MTSSDQWRCIGAATLGEAHARHGVPCQDAWAWAQVNDALLLAVADGAGSAPRAEVGSARAVDAALDALMSIHPLLAGNLEAAGPDAVIDSLRQALSAVHGALQEMAARENAPMRDFATTLLIAVVTPTHTAAAQVGDGAIVCAMEDASKVMALTRPQHGEYVNVTTFITASDFLECAQFCYLPEPARHLALLTDGLEPIAIGYRLGKPCDGLFSGLFRYMEACEEPIMRRSLLEWLDSERIRDRSDDDKTLLLASRLSPMREEVRS